MKPANLLECCDKTSNEYIQFYKQLCTHRIFRLAAFLCGCNWRIEIDAWSDLNQIIEDILKYDSMLRLYYQELERYHRRARLEFNEVGSRLNITVHPLKHHTVDKKVDTFSKRLELIDTRRHDLSLALIFISCGFYPTETEWQCAFCKQSELFKQYDDELFLLCEHRRKKCNYALYALTIINMIKHNNRANSLKDHYTNYDFMAKLNLFYWNDHVHCLMCMHQLSGSFEEIIAQHENTDCFSNEPVDYKPDNVINNTSIVHGHMLHAPTRLKTFEGISNSFLRENASTFVEAGFFSKKIEDIVCCFRCGYVIHRWECYDDPYVEHVKYNPHCVMMRLLWKPAVINTILQVDVSRRRGKNVDYPKAPTIEECTIATDICEVCAFFQKDTVFQSCGHRTCGRCAASLLTCPFCRCKIKAFIKYF